MFGSTCGAADLVVEEPAGPEEPAGRTVAAGRADHDPLQEVDAAAGGRGVDEHVAAGLCQAEAERLRPRGDTGMRTLLSNEALGGAIGRGPSGA